MKSPVLLLKCVHVLCALQGVCMLFLPRIGLTLFIVFYTFGNICTLGRSVSTTISSNNEADCDSFVFWWIVIVYIFTYDSAQQHHFSDGATEAAQKDVWQNKSTGHHYYASKCTVTDLYFYLVTFSPYISAAPVSLSSLMKDWWISVLLLMLSRVLFTVLDLPCFDSLRSLLGKWF